MIELDLIRRRRGVTLSLGVLLAVACGDPAEDAGEDGSTGVDSAMPGETETPGDTDGPGDTDAPGDTDEPADTDEPGDTDEPPIEVTCDANVNEVDGAVRHDVEVRCDDFEFAEPGLSVQPGEAAVYLATASSNRGFLFELDAGGISGDPVLPEPFTRTSLGLVRTVAGDLIAAADTTALPDYAGGFTLLRPIDGGYEEELIFDAKGTSSAPVAFEVAPDGSIHAWYFSDPPEELSRSVRDASGTWSAEVSDTPPGGGWHDFTLDLEDRAAAFDWVENGNGNSQLTARIGGETQTWGAPVGSFPIGYALASRPMPSNGDATAGLVAAIQREDLLEVLFDADAGIALEDSQQWTPTCEVFWDDGCVETCHEQGRGIQNGVFSVARTEAGDTFVAFVVTTSNIRYSYIEDNNDDPGPMCSATIDSDESTAELRIARISNGGEAAELVWSDVVPVPASNVFDGPFVNAIDAEAFGSDLAVAVRLRDGDEGFVRVVQLDTEAL